MRSAVATIFCDGNDGMCGSWTTDDYVIGVAVIGDVRITREQPSPGWRHNADFDEDLCPSCLAAGASSATEAVTEPETVRWPDYGPGRERDTAWCGEKIVAWINANGGEARYEPGRPWSHGKIPHGPRIVITGPDGDVVMAPGDEAVKGRMVKCSHCAFSWHVPDVECSARVHTPQFTVRRPFVANPCNCGEPEWPHRNHTKDEKAK